MISSLFHAAVIKLPGLSRSQCCSHDDILKWKHFSRYWPFVRGIHRSPGALNGQWRWVLVFSLICAWINGWVNNREAGDLRRHHANFDVIVMIFHPPAAPFTNTEQNKTNGEKQKGKHKTICNTHNGWYLCDVHDKFKSKQNKIKKSNEINSNYTSGVHHSTLLSPFRSLANYRKEVWLSFI